VRAAAVIGIALVAAASAACTAGGSPATRSPAPIATVFPTPVAASPSPTRTPTPTPTTEPLPTPTPTAAAGGCPSDTAEPAVPPNASLVAADGTQITGRLGSYEFCNTAADALPPKSASLTTVPLGDSATVGLTLAGGTAALSSYRATYWNASEWQGDEIKLGTEAFDPPVSAASFAGPPAGDWMLAAHVFFATGETATYYWHVTVP
jgi:hypothetical protein